MDQSATSTPKALEDQLRGMILSNVRIGDVQPDQRPTGGRGRGQGHYSRGNSSGYQSRAQKSQPYRGSMNSPSTARGGPVALNDHQSYRQQQPLTSPHAQQERGFPPREMATGPSGGRVTRGIRQPQQSRAQLWNREEVTPHNEAPRVLQRPHNGGVPPVRGRYNSVPAQHPHTQATYQQPESTQNPKNPFKELKYLDELAADEIPRFEMSQAELEEKEAFRQQLESLMQRAIAEKYYGDIGSISLVGFGSLSSGFGMPGSDMDLAMVSAWRGLSRADELAINRDIPRLLEKAVLDSKMGGRLLTRTRVPILKICQYPTEVLYSALSKERRKWEGLSEEGLNPTDHSSQPSQPPIPLVDIDGGTPAQLIQHADSPDFEEAFPKIGATPLEKAVAMKARAKATVNDDMIPPTSPFIGVVDSKDKNTNTTMNHQPRAKKPWTREKSSGPLEFPKDGVGIHCDVNFDNPLGIHNTHMLRCYSLTDPRVRPVVLFVKAWAKRRQINSAYSGTLSSYGWVLMVLHYLVNIAKPPVCPNLQLAAVPQAKDLEEAETFSPERPLIRGYVVRFWQEEDIRQAAQAGPLSQNTETVGSLLRGFFRYYTTVSPSGSYGSPPTRQFHWVREVLSLRTPGGILTKQQKGWVSQETTVTVEKKVTNRYLFSIEDPFELDHNVARTVTFGNCKTIREEFSRVWRILGERGSGMENAVDEIFDVPQPPDHAKVKKGGIEELGMKEEGQRVEVDQQADIHGNEKVVFT